MGRPGLYANIAAKKRRIKAGSGETMRKPGSRGAPTKANFKRAAQTVKKNDDSCNILCIFICNSYARWDF